MIFNISKLFYFLAAAILFALGFDLWNPTSAVDWNVVAVAFIATGLFFNEVGPKFNPMVYVRQPPPQ